jgi:hypothetical protein
VNNQIKSANFDPMQWMERNCKISPSFLNAIQKHLLSKNRQNTAEHIILLAGTHTQEKKHDLCETFEDN